jgi:hypothetical protein
MTRDKTWDANLLVRMAEAQGTQMDTTAHPRRVLKQATVDYRRLHRGLSSMQNDKLGAEGESRPAAGTKIKQATSETLGKAGEKTLQVQMIQKVLEQLGSMENQMKQMEDRRPHTGVGSLRNHRGPLTKEGSFGGILRKSISLR